MSFTAVWEAARSSPHLFLLAGPNGAGKTTLYESVLKESGLPFINPDVIAQSLESISNPFERMRASQKQADSVRDDLLHRRASFITETVFSHESKLDLVEQAKSEGFTVVLFFITVGNVELLKRRVAHRVTVGGHDVPEDRIVSRYGRTMELVPRAIPRCDYAFVYDNAGALPLRCVISFRDGIPMMISEDLPDWALEVLQKVARS